jgi:hypothetical protein
MPQRVQRLVMTRQNRPGQVVKAFAAGLALVTLAKALRAVVAAPDRVAAVAMRAGDAASPTQLPDGVVAVGFVDQLSDGYDRGFH